MTQKTNGIRAKLRLPYLLNVNDSGSNKPAIILLHGIATSSQSWSKLMPLLEKEYRCITIDLLGFGQSPKPTACSYTMEEHLRSVHHTIQSLKLTEPFILAGHSMGALIACRYSARNPKKVSRLLMLSPPLYLHPTHINSKYIKSATNTYLRAYQFLRTHKKFTITNLNRFMKLSPRDSLFEITEDTWLPSVRSLENCIEKQTVITDMAEVECTADIFWGTLDQFIVRKNLNVIARMKNVELHELANVDHMVREKYARHILKVLKNEQ